MIIERKELELLKNINKWVLVYGRRKTGKTFLVKQFLPHDEYFFVKRDKTIIVESTGNDIAYDAFKELFTRLLADGKTLVVDEFHRLGDDFLDYLHFMNKKGKLILISSTFHLAKKIFGKKSPLLGLFAEFPVGLLDLGDVVKNLSHISDKKTRLELAMFMKEPLTIDFYKEGLSSQTLLPVMLSTSKHTVPALIGEIFTEEERNLSAVYEGILRAIAIRKQISTEISSFLFSRKLVPKDNPGGIQPYLNNLVNFGIIKRVKIFNKNIFVYQHLSPLVELYYYCDEKYNLSEIQPDSKFVSMVVEQILPIIIEAHVREFLAEKLGLVESIIKEKDYDIDGCLLRFKKPETLVEIKWKKQIGTEDIKRTEEVLSKISSRKKLLFVPDKRSIKHKIKGIEIVDILDFV